jgi:hypothetical protein
MSQAHPLSVVHMSFKVPDAETYENVCDRMDQSPEMSQVQACLSSYGAFSYWHVNGATSGIYLKPRVNLRDREVVEIDVTEAIRNISTGTVTKEDWDAEKARFDAEKDNDRGEFGMPGLGQDVRPFQEGDDK